MRIESLEARLAKIPRPPIEQLRREQKYELAKEIMEFVPLEEIRSLRNFYERIDEATDEKAKREARAAIAELANSWIKRWPPLEKTVHEFFRGGSGKRKQPTETDKS